MPADARISAGHVVVHVPHASVDLGPCRDQFVLPDAELADEVRTLTDHLTLEMAASAVGEERIVAFPLSRLVVDVERFRNNAAEPMAARGMGFIYERTHDGRPLRRSLTSGERARLGDLYDAHHARLTVRVEDALRAHGRALVVDVHSFPSAPLPCDLDQAPDRPDICLGTTEPHTSAALLRTARSSFEAVGWRVEIDRPYRGTMVPLRYLGVDARVQSLMVEVNRVLYLDEATGVPLAAFDHVCGRLAFALREVIDRTG